MKRVTLVLLLTGILCLPGGFVNAQVLTSASPAVEPSTARVTPGRASSRSWATLGPVEPLPDPSTVARKVLLPLYVIFSGPQVLDTAEPDATIEPSTTLGLRMAARVGTIFAAERLWATNPAGAVLLMVTVNGSMALSAWRSR